VASPAPAVNPRLSIPSSRPTRLYREIVRALRGDPTLDRVVKTWRTWDGTPVSDDRQITAAMCPYVEAMPALNGLGPPDNLTQEATLRVDFTIATSGYFVEDVMDLWTLVEHAVYPRDQTLNREVRHRLALLGATTTPVQIVLPAAPDARSGGGVMLGNGAISLTYNIQGNQVAGVH
jgi:hypothetical protein